MANELSVTVAFTYQKGNSSKQNWSYGPKKSNVSGSTATFGQIVSVGTSEEAIPLGETTAAGAMMIVKNMDDTNYIEIRSGTGASNDFWKVPAGETHIFRFGSDVSAPYWIANTAACSVEFHLIPA